MLTHLALLPLAAITVTGVTSENHDSDVIIDVATSEPVPAHVARPMAGHRLLYVFVDDATPTDAVFENGDHPSWPARARATPSSKFRSTPACAATSLLSSRPCLGAARPVLLRHQRWHSRDRRRRAPAPRR